MRLSLLVSKYPEYSLLRTQSRSLALVWQAGHGALALSGLATFGAILVLVAACLDPELMTDRPSWPIVGALVCWALLCAFVGIALKRYVIRKGKALSAAH
jgi:hypothetical protein